MLKIIIIQIKVINKLNTTLITTWGCFHKSSSCKSYYLFRDASSSSFYTFFLSFYYFCFIIYCIFLAINSCCICLIDKFTSIGVILPSFKFFYSYYTLSPNYGWLCNYFFIWASIWSWIVFCCSVEGWFIIWGPLFIMCCCIFIIVFCWIWNYESCCPLVSSKTYCLNFFWSLYIYNIFG